MPFDGTTYREPVIRDALVGGRKRIEQGWCSTGARTHDGSGVCAIMALKEASPDWQTYVRAGDLLRAAVKETGFALGGVVEYNDSHSRGEVLAIYDRAIGMSRGLSPRPRPRKIQPWPHGRTKS